MILRCHQGLLLAMLWVPGTTVPLHLLDTRTVRAVIYCRISDDRTGLAAGVKRQEDDARSLCERNGWDVVGVEVDNDISASRYSRKVRPAYQRVLAMATASTVDVIACYDVDRLYRRPAELEDLIDVAEQVIVASVQGDVRLDTADGRAVARVLAAMAAKASDDTSRRVKRKHLETATAGLPSGGGPRPFGFDDDRITVRPSEAARIQEAAARLLAGDTLGAICRDWAADGVTTPLGNTWQTSALRRVLEAPRVAGMRSLGAEVVADAVWAPILDRDTWEALRATLRGRGPTMAAGYGARSYLLSGVIRCAACNVAMTAHPTGSRGYRYRRYFCLKTRGGCNRVGISADHTETYVVDAMLARLTAGSDLSPAGRVDVGGGVVLELAQQEATLAELAESLTAGRVTVRAYETAVGAVERRIDALRTQLAASTRRGVLVDLSKATDPAAIWAAMPFDRQRLAVAETFEAVMIAPSSGRGARFEPDRITPIWRD